MNLHGQNRVGDMLSAEGTATFRAVNPSNGEVLEPDFIEATLQEIDAAANLAKNAFDANSRIPAEQIARLLEAIGDAIMEIGDDLLHRANAETGLPFPRLTMERGRTVGQLKMFAGLVREGSWVDARIDQANPDRQPLPKPDVRRMLIPIGPVAVFGASNFPLAFSVAGGDTASALAAGNPVVVKAHPAHPGTSEMVAEAVAQALRAVNMPAGWFSLLHGKSIEVGAELVKHPAIRAVGFTGSLRAGRALFDIASARPDPIPVFAEMGSINPVFVLPNALNERGVAIAEGLSGSITMGVGQFCTKPGLIFGTGDAVLQSFQLDLTARLGQVPAATMLHDGIRRAYLGSTEKTKQAEGVVVACEGETAEEGKVGAKLFVTNAETWVGNPTLHEEMFGPAAILIACGTGEEIINAAKHLEGQLTATVHANVEDMELLMELLPILERKVGRIVFNGYPTGVEFCHAMNHGGPYPATTAPQTTSVGSAAIFRFVRPISYQNAPAPILPAALHSDNPLGILRLVDGVYTREQEA